MDEHELIQSTIEQTLETAKGMTDYGASTIMAAAFLVLSVIIIVMFVLWFIKIINGIIDNQKQTLDKLSVAVNQQTEILNDLKDGLQEKTYLQAVTISEFAFSYSEKLVEDQIYVFKNENNIEEKENTQTKVEVWVKAMVEDRNSKLDTFAYKGKPLSAFFNTKFIDDIIQTILTELYKPKDPYRTRNAIGLLYKRIKTDFQQKLKTE